MVDTFTETKELNREGCTAMRLQSRGSVAFLAKKLPHMIGRDNQPTLKQGYTGSIMDAFSPGITLAGCQVESGKGSQ